MSTNLLVQLHHVDLNNLMKNYTTAILLLGILNGIPDEEVGRRYDNKTNGNAPPKPTHSKS